MRDFWKKNGLVIIILVLVVSGILGLFVYQTFVNSTEDTAKSEISVVRNTSNDFEERTTNPTPEIETLAATAGKYVILTENENAIAEADTENVVLFFSAFWCPTCQAFEADVEQRPDELPLDTTIIEIEYNQYLDLETKYDISIQHTYVQIDENGEQINKWVGGNTIETISDNLI